jgi:hypothetical protein
MRDRVYLREQNRDNSLKLHTTHGGQLLNETYIIYISAVLWPFYLPADSIPKLILLSRRRSRGVLPAPTLFSPAVL